MLAILFLAGFLLTGYADLFAQPEKVHKGDRIKISASSYAAGSIRGTVVDISESEVRVRTKEANFNIPLSSIKTVHISYGKRRHGKVG
ncbi:MAG: hypothetical protein R3211_07765, partial [Balneolaceae bacterium]|nr:hypothetical protein [Balneolaceae bacterium]